LVPPQEDGYPGEAIEAAARAAETYLDVEALWHVAHQAPPHSLPIDGAAAGPSVERPARTGDRPRIGYFYDAAFHFYYADNLEALEHLGAVLVPVDARQAAGLPSDLDGLYIGGGFPEQCAPALSANAAMRESVRRAAEDGMPVYAECGGLMYLGRELQTGLGRFAMAGVFPFSTVLESTPQGHGYVEAEVVEGHPFLAAGTRIKGHEFHYSRPVEWSEGEVRFALKLSRGRGFSDGRDGLAYKNTFATYVHVHAVGEPLWASSVVELCRKNRQSRRSIDIQSDVVVSAAN
jgi:cobyrinic acid a,c-diamide synthase